MRRTSLFVLVLAVLLLVPSIASPAAAQDDIEVRGMVRDTSRAPLSGITITATAVSDSDPNVVRTNVSGEDGAYVLPLQPGIYHIAASSADYRSDSPYSNITLTSSMDNMDFEMTERVGTVLGHVSNETGPIANATVSMVGAGNLVYTSKTNETGDYRIENVRVGTYTISITAVMGGDLKIVEVSEGENLQSWNLTGQSTLRGVVRSGQEPMADVSVTISSGVYSHTVTTSSDGRYEISNIPTGEYTVTFSKSGYQTSESPVDLRLPKYYTLDMEMERMGLPISEGFLSGYDLPHSLMIVALGMAVGTLIFALLVRHRFKKRPEMLNKEESD